MPVLHELLPQSCLLEELAVGELVAGWPGAVAEETAASGRPLEAS